MLLVKQDVPWAYTWTKQQLNKYLLQNVHSTFSSAIPYTTDIWKNVKVAHTRLPSVGFRSWSRFWQSTCRWRESNPTVGCHYFPPGLQLPPQPLRGLLPILLLGEQRHNGCEQFAQDCYTTALRLRFEPGPFSVWVQHANHWTRASRTTTDIH